MACAITKGRGVGCKTAFAGIKNIYILDYSAAIAALSDSSGTITLPTDNSAEFFKFEVKGGQSSLETVVNSSRENGTTFYTQTLNLTLHKLTKEDNKELKLMAYGRPHVIVEDYNKNLFVMGLENGADVSGGTIVTGAAMGDLSGYTLTLTGMEKVPANFIEKTSATESVDTSLTNAGISTITQGSNS